MCFLSAHLAYRQHRDQSLTGWLPPRSIGPSWTLPPSLLAFSNRSILKEKVNGESGPDLLVRSVCLSWKHKEDIQGTCRSSILVRGTCTHQQPSGCNCRCTKTPTDLLQLADRGQRCIHSLKSDRWKDTECQTWGLNQRSVSGSSSNHHPSPETFKHRGNPQDAEEGNRSLRVNRTCSQVYPPTLTTA